MKSKVLCTTAAALTFSVATLATAATGFAATVNTTTTYNGASGKVEVTTNVTEISGENEIAYLVKNSEDKIVYIDQHKAEQEGTDYVTTFTYKIKKADIPTTNLSTSVLLGSSGTDTFAASSLELGNITVNAPDCTVAYWKDALGKVAATGIVAPDETVYVELTAPEGKELATVTVDDAAQDKTAKIYAVAHGQTLTATVVDSIVDPGIINEEVKAIVGEKTVTEAIAPVAKKYVSFEGGKRVEKEVATAGTYEYEGKPYTEALPAVVSLIQPKGNPFEVGVYYDGIYYPSIADDKNAPCAVKLVFIADGEDPIFVPTASLRPYYIPTEGATPILSDPQEFKVDSYNAE